MKVKKKYCKKNKLNKIYGNKLMAFFALKKSIKVIFFNYLKLFVNVNMELDKNVNLEIGQFVPILFH